MLTIEWNMEIIYVTTCFCLFKNFSSTLQLGEQVSTFMHIVGPSVIEEESYLSR